MSYSTAYDRWAGVGPYYAMFPNDLVKKVILAYTEPKQRILDPFAGRASTVFTGAVNGRPSIGIEINPIGWIYGKTKLVPAQPAEVKVRLAEIAEATNKLSKNAGENLPEFFSWCFSQNSLRFLLTARDNLNWKYNRNWGNRPSKCRTQSSLVQFSSFLSLKLGFFEPTKIVFDN